MTGQTPVAETEQTDERLLWSVKRTAEEFAGVSESLVRKWIREGQLRAKKKGPKLLFIDPADARAFKESFPDAYPASHDA